MLIIYHRYYVSRFNLFSKDLSISLFCFFFFFNFLYLNECVTVKGNCLNGRFTVAKSDMENPSVTESRQKTKNQQKNTRKRCEICSESTIKTPE